MEGSVTRNAMKKGYPFRIWALAFLLPAVVATLYIATTGTIELLPLVGGGILVAGAVLSLPALLGNYYLCRHLAESALETHVAKTYIVLAGFGFVAATFLIGVFFWDNGVEDQPLFLGAIAAYGVSAGIGAVLFQLRGNMQIGHEQASHSASLPADTPL